MTNQKPDTSDDEWGNIELPSLSDEELLNPNLNYVLANQAKAKTEQWQKAYAEGRKKVDWSAVQQKRFEDPEVYAEQAERNKQQAQDPKWIEATRKGSKKRNKNLQWKKNVVRASTVDRDPVKHGEAVKAGRANWTEEQYNSWRENNKKGQREKRKRPTIHTPDGIFPGIVEAVEYYDVNHSTIMRRLRNKNAKWAEWYYVEENK